MLIDVPTACFRDGNHGGRTPNPRIVQSHRPSSVSAKSMSFTQRDRNHGLAPNARPAPSAGDILGRLRSVAVVHNLVGAKRLGLLQFPVIDVGGHDADGWSTRRSWTAMCPQPPNTEDNNGALSIEVRQRPLYRVVRRPARHHSAELPSLDSSHQAEPAVARSGTSMYSAIPPSRPSPPPKPSTEAQFSQ